MEIFCYRTTSVLFIKYTMIGTPLTIVNPVMENLLYRTSLAVYVQHAVIGTPLSTNRLIHKKKSQTTLVLCPLCRQIM